MEVFFMHFLKNKNGFSLLEVLIAMSLATGLLLFLMKIQEQHAKSQKTTQTSMEIDSFINDLKGTLARTGFCEKSFIKLPLKDNVATPVTSIISPRGEIRYAVGEKYGNNTIKLLALTIKNFKPDDIAGRSGVGELEVLIEKQANVSGAKTVTRKFDFVLTRDESDVIIGCGNLALVAPPPIIINVNTPTNAPTPNTSSQEEQQKIIDNNPDLKKAQEFLELLKKMQEEIKNIETE